LVRRNSVELDFTRKNTGAGSDLSTITKVKIVAEIGDLGYCQGRD
jgi:hypothetical protein